MKAFRLRYLGPTTPFFRILELAFPDSDLPPSPNDITRHLYVSHFGDMELLEVGAPGNLPDIQGSDGSSLWIRCPFSANSERVLQNLNPMGFRVYSRLYMERTLGQQSLQFRVRRLRAAKPPIRPQALKRNKGKSGGHLRPLPTRIHES